MRSEVGRVEEMGAMGWGGYGAGLYPLAGLHGSAGPGGLPLGPCVGAGATEGVEVQDLLGEATVAAARGAEAARYSRRSGLAAARLNRRSGVAAAWHCRYPSPSCFA